MDDIEPGAEEGTVVGTPLGVPETGDGIAAPADFRFSLYICGATEKSQRAVAHARRLCDEYLPGRYSLEIIDLYRHPELAQLRDIFATPTLIRELPRPLRRYIGDLSENERLVFQLAPLVIDRRGG